MHFRSPIAKAETAVGHHLCLYHPHSSLSIQSRPLEYSSVTQLQPFLKEPREWAHQGMSRRIDVAKYDSSKAFAQTIEILRTFQLQPRSVVQLHHITARPIQNSRHERIDEGGNGGIGARLIGRGPIRTCGRGMFSGSTEAL